MWTLTRIWLLLLSRALNRHTAHIPSQDPVRFVDLDPDMARTLLDQRDSGKILVLVTNSDYQ